MIIASWDQLIGYDGMTFQPYCRYVVTDASFERISASVDRAGGNIITSSGFNNSQKFTRKHVPNRRIAVYRHTAYGDQLIMTGLCAYLKYLWPDCRIFYFCSPELVDIWRWNPHIEFCGGPMPLETANAMNDHLFFESMFECDSEHDQRNCYDTMFAAAGFDPEDVPICYKKPFLFFSEKDTTTQRLLKGEYGDYLIYHWSSSNPNRMYPAEQSIATLQLLSQRLPLYKILVVGDRRDRETCAIPDIERVVDLRGRTRTFRDVIQFIANAELIIGPDSSVMHAAAALNKPCVSLWGLFHPEDRIKYYPFNFPLVGFDACPHAPCRNHDFKLPAKLCRDAENHVEPPEFCNALRSIAPLQIARTAYHIITTNGRSNSKITTTHDTDESNPPSGQVEVPVHRGTEVG